MPKPVNTSNKSLVLSLDQEQSSTIQSKANPLRYKKTIARVGKYFKKDEDNVIEFDITADVLNHWQDTFKTYTANGNRVYVPVLHTNNPEKNRGYVEDMFIEDDKLQAVFEFRDEEAAKLASCSNTSVFSLSMLTDGHGNEYI